MRWSIGKKKGASQAMAHDADTVMLHEQTVDMKYRRKRGAISEQEAQMSAELLKDPRIAAADFSVITQYEDDDPDHPFLRLVSTRPGDTAYHGPSTETDLSTFAFVASVMRDVERREVTEVLESIRHRVAVLGFDVASIGSFRSEGNCSFEFKDVRYDRTHAGLQKFLFDLNAEEIFHKICLQFADDFRRLNWFVLKNERDFDLYMDGTVRPFNFCEQSIEAIKKLIEEAVASGDPAE